MKQSSAVLHSIKDGNDYRQLLILYVDELGRFFGHMEVGGGNRSHGMTFEQDFAAGQYVVAGKFQGLVTGAQFLFG